MSRKHHLIATAFDKKGNILGAGINDYHKSHPLMKIYNEKSGDHKEKIYLHAEMVACLRSGTKVIHSVLVQRFNQQGNPALAKPCLTCMCMLKDFGVKMIRYTSEEGIKSEQI